jgi:glutamate-ammonia-ligase adenylyltransferase
LATFIDYHARSSAPWEKQSLLRARLVAGDRGLGQQAMAAAKRAAFSGAPAHLGQRLLDMRARMVAERAARQGLDLKMGEGGLADVEFAVQGLQMVRGEKDASVWCPSTRRGLRHLTRKGHVSVDVGARLSGAYEQLLRAREALALVDDKREPSVNRSDPRLDLLARAGVLDGKSGAEVYDALAAASATIRELTWRILARL